jgi:hypothetical protein
LGQQLVYPSADLSLIGQKVLVVVLVPEVGLGLLFKGGLNIEALLGEVNLLKALMSTFTSSSNSSPNWGS